MPLYSRVHAAVTGSDAPGAASALPLRVYYHCTHEFSVLAYASVEYEMYAICDPLASKPEVVQICQRLCAWVKSKQADLFVPV